VYLVSVRLVLYGLATIAAAISASTFGWWKEHLGRAWTMFAAEYLLLFVNYVLRRTFPDSHGALDATLIGANVAQIVAYWMMAGVLAAAGIGYLMTPSKRTLLTIAALAVALLLCFGTLMAEWQLLTSGQLRPGSIISLLTDVITFTLVAPLAMSAFALRGGQLSWIFGFLTISVFGWMVNGSGDSIVTLIGGGTDAVRTVRLAGLATASLFNAAAAATQSIAARRAMKRSGLDE
jgi:hypothetical protein